MAPLMNLAPPPAFRRFFGRVMVATGLFFLTFCVIALVHILAAHTLSFKGIYYATSVLRVVFLAALLIYVFMLGREMVVLLKAM